MTTAAKKILWSTAGSLTSTTAYVCFQAKYDPPHLIWDLDNTLLCSVTPLDTAPRKGYEAPGSFFDQVDDDFPFEGNGAPNTRTYWRPGARGALQFFRLFTVQHVFTAAQATYTENILQQMDRSLFSTIIHRDLVPQRNGKDLQETIKACQGSANIRLGRCVLWDDRTKNFRPQNGENGLHVVPFEVGTGGAAWREYQEIARWVGVAVLALLAPDVRWVLPYFRSEEHKERFSANDQAKEEKPRN